MRLVLALITVACVTACNTAAPPAPAPAEEALLRHDDEWRQKQAVIDAEAILHGMAMARERREQLARSAR